MKNYCLDCNKEISKFAKRCRSCSKIGNQNAEGHKCSEKAKQQMSESMFGLKRSKEGKQNISKGLLEYHSEKRGGKPPLYQLIAEKEPGSGSTKSGFSPKKATKEKTRKSMLKYYNNDNPGAYTKTLAKLCYKEEYKLWRLKVLIRDKFLCRNCGKVGPIVHHLIDLMKIKDIPELLYNTDIGLTLCRSCHSKIHHQTRLLNK